MVEDFEELKRGLNESVLVQTWEGLELVYKKVRNLEHRFPVLNNLWLEYLDRISTPQELARESPLGPQNLEHLQVLCAQVKSLLSEFEKRLAIPSLNQAKPNQPAPVAYLERLSVPNFSGKELDYPDFKHKFN